MLTLVLSMRRAGPMRQVLASVRFQALATQHRVETDQTLALERTLLLSAAWTWWVAAQAQPWAVHG